MTPREITRAAVLARIDRRTAKRTLTGGPPPRSHALRKALAEAVRALGYEDEAKRIEANNHAS